MDYKEKVIALSNSKELSQEQKEKLESTFPELKESEDERIRESLLKYLHTLPNHYSHSGVCAPEWISWIEKQGESSVQIHYWTEEEIEPIISDYLRGAEHYGGMIGRLRCLKPKSLEKQGEQNEKMKKDIAEFIFNSREDIKHRYDWIKCLGYDIHFIDKEKQGSQNIANSAKTCKDEQKPVDKVEPKFKVGDTIQPKDRGHESWQIMQVDILDKKYRFKDGYVIHFSQEDNYELVEQTHAWSEKDEIRLKHILCLLDVKDDKKYLLMFGLNSLQDLKKDIAWLKSLRPQNTWKPSDEQIKVCKEVYADMLSAKGFDLSTVNSELNRLEEQLKKLKGE